MKHTLIAIREPFLFIIYLIADIIGGIICYPWMLYVSWFAPETNHPKPRRR